MAEKQIYWMKLPLNFFEEDVIDWLLEQPNGKDYVIFYLRLCLKSAKTEGILIRAIGNLLMPYDAKKLAELTRTEVDTVVVALELLKQVGLIEILGSGELYLAAVKNMVGVETKWAEKKRLQRARRTSEGQCPPGVPELSDQSIEKEIEEEKKKEKKESDTQRRFIPPTSEEVLEYCREKKLEHLEPLEFIDFYESKGWVVGKAKMKDWKAAVRRWNRGNEQSGKPKAKWVLEEQKGVRQSLPENDELKRRLALMED